MKPFVHTTKEEKKVKLQCLNATIWPPSEAYFKENLEHLRENGDLTDERYEAHKVWVRHCGKFRMDEHCTLCPKCQIEARVRARATGRYTNRRIGYQEAQKIPKDNIHIKYEK